MAAKTSKFMIGIFATVGVVLAVVTIVWLGASKYFQKGTIFVTYFDESVQGLSVDSNVKYRGVNVGTIRDIRVAPDNKLIEVVMKISMRSDVQKDVIAKLKAAGLTGIVYIDLDQTREDSVELSPKIDFSTKYPVIMSRPSDAKYILSMVDNIVSELNRIDLKGMFQEVKSITKGIDQFVNGPKMVNIVNSLDSTATHLDHAIRKIDSIVAEGKIESILGEAKGTLVETRAVVAKIKDDLDKMKLADSVGKANQIVTGVDKSIKDITLDLKTTSGNLQKASENLDILVDKLRDDPSELLFSRPPPVSPRER